MVGCVYKLQCPYLCMSVSLCVCLPAHPQSIPQGSCRSYTLKLLWTLKFVKDSESLPKGYRGFYQCDPNVQIFPLFFSLLYVLNVFHVSRQILLFLFGQNIKKVWAVSAVAEDWRSSSTCLSTGTAPILGQRMSRLKRWLILLLLLLPAQNIVPPQVSANSSQKAATPGGTVA